MIGCRLRWAKEDEVIFAFRPSPLSEGGFTATDFRFVEANVLGDKPGMHMPALRDRAETLEVVLRDEVAGPVLRLCYTVVGGALARHTEIENIGSSPITLGTLDSSCTELDIGEYDYISLDGR